MSEKSPRLPTRLMNRRDALAVAAAFGTVIGAGLMLPAAASAAESAQKSGAISFTDLAGRRVTLAKRPERFVVANYILNFLMISGASGVDKIVGLTQDGWLETRRGEYTLLKDAFPALMDKPSIGGYHDSILNSEKILALKPDVVLVNRTQFADNTGRLRIFEAAGIPVVVLDYHSMTLANHTTSTEILGRLLGREDVARAQCERYRSVLQEIASRIAKLDDSRKHTRVYIEAGNRGVAEYGNSYNRTVLWGAILENLAADNLARDMKQPYGALDREFVVGRNPQVIIMAGSLWENVDSSDFMRMGLTVSEGTAQKRLAGFAKRPMWQNLDALKNGRFYGIDHGSLRCMMDYAFSIYLAQVLYPGVFDDMKPDEEIASFFAKYLPELKAQGTFFTQLKR